MIEALRGMNVTQVACGSNHSAVVVDNKELYTWGSGEFGRLGHGNEETQFLPKLVSSPVLILKLKAILVQQKQQLIGFIL